MSTLYIMNECDLLSDTKNEHLLFDISPKCWQTQWRRTKYAKD